MEYELTFDVKWCNDDSYFAIDIDINNADAVKIFDDDGKQIGKPKVMNGERVLEDVAVVRDALCEAQIQVNGYSADDYEDEFWAGPVLFEMNEVNGYTNTIKFTSDDVEVLKRDGGVEFREAELQLKRGIRSLLRLTSDNVDETRDRFIDVLNRVLTEEIMDT